MDRVVWLTSLLERQTTADVSDSREADMFDVGIDNELGGSRNKGNVASSRGGGGAPSSKRQRKDDKYGFGGKKRPLLFTGISLTI
jgi:rRNA-processing protein EBP2